MDGSGKINNAPVYTVYNPLGEETGETIRGEIVIASAWGALYVVDVQVGDKLLRRLIHLTADQVSALGHLVRPPAAITIGK